MKVEVLQDDNTLEHQRQLVAEALPELDSFIIIGHRAPGRGKASHRVRSLPGRHAPDIVEIERYCDALFDTIKQAAIYYHNNSDIPHKNN